MITESHSLTDADRKKFDEVGTLAAAGPTGVARLIEMLTDQSWVVRRAVVESLAKTGEAAVQPLCKLLVEKRDSEARIAAVVDALSNSVGTSVDECVMKLASHKDPAVAADVAQVLGRRRSHKAVPTLITLTKHQNDNVAVGAIEALGRIGGRSAVEALVEIVNSGNFFRTFPAIDVLGRSGDPRAIEPLIKLLSSSTYLPEAMRALGRSGEKAAVKPLAELLGSTSDALIRVAAAALSDLGLRYQEKSGGEVVIIEELVRSLVKTETVRRIARVLPNSEPNEAAEICRVLGMIANPEAAPQLTLVLEKFPSIADEATSALRKIGRDADEPLIKAIREGSSERRKVLLPLVTKNSAAPDVAGCLSDSDPEVRALACDALVRLGNSTVVSQIFPLLGSDNLRVVHSATAAIQSLGSRESLELAVKAAASPNAVMRRSALRILSYFGDSSALKPLLNGLADIDPRVREAAIQGLPFLEDIEAHEALFLATKSELPRTRALAMRALGQLVKPNERVHSLLLKGLTDQDPWVRYYACQSLGRLRYTQSSTDIIKLLSDEAGQVRVAAVEALSHLESSEAHQALRNAAASVDVEVKRAALVGLGIARRHEDLPVLLAAASENDSSTRLMALSALASFPSSTVFAVLSGASVDHDEQVSSTAIAILGGRPEQEATEILIDLLYRSELNERARAALMVPSEGRIAGLLTALEVANDEQAAMIISVLSRLDRQDARYALLAAIRLQNAAARKAAAPALAARRDPEMTVALQEAATNDPSKEVRQICSLLIRQ